MADNSRVILDKNDISTSASKHISRLISAGAVIGNIDDTLTPTGTWGSVAKITFKASQLAEKKEKEWVYDNHTVTLNSDELDFEFEVPFDDDLEANEGEIVVYNLSSKTLNALKAIAKNDEHSVCIEAGYKDDTGVIYEGRITKIDTKRSNSDKATTIKVTDNIEQRTVNISFDAGSTAQHILGKLLDMLSYPIAIFKPVRDHTYENAETVDDSLMSAIKKYSEVCGVSTFISRGLIYCCKLKEVDNTSIFSVRESTGMIGSPNPFVEEGNREEYEDKVEGVTIDMLLQHRMSAGAKIRLISDGYSGTYYVKSGSHTFNESECITNFTAINKESYKVTEKEEEEE